MQRRMLMRESAEQMPHLTQTATGGNRMAIRPRKMSDERHITEIWISCRISIEIRISDKRTIRKPRKVLYVLSYLEEVEWCFREGLAPPRHCSLSHLQRR